MIIVMYPQTDLNTILAVQYYLTKHGHKAHLCHYQGQDLLITTQDLDQVAISNLRGVERVVTTPDPFLLASRYFQLTNTQVEVGSVAIGGQEPVIIAGPCAVESRESFLEAALIAQRIGIHMLRGGAYKPRTSPYSFQGLEEKGLKIMVEARERTGLPFVTEVMSPEQVPLVAEYADMLQVGCRNSQNFSLLKAVGRAGKPVLLKRGLAMTINEWLQSAEYILAEGNSNIVLCERGIRTFETATRNTLDLNAIPALQEKTHLPVIVDPSHGTGKRKYVRQLARAAIAVGASGLIVEMHPNPERALSDGHQSLDAKELADLVTDIECIAEVLGNLTSN